MRKFLSLIVLIALVCGNIQSMAVAMPEIPPLTSSDNQLIEDAFKNQISNIQVEGQGIVIKLLTDDLKGSRHQRFIVKLDTGQTLLIAHNIDLAPRIHSLQKGESIVFYGEYEWNTQGGIVHWTHRDSEGHHVDGWIKHKGKIYQ